MNCPKCQALDTKVIDSRVHGCCVRRRRECTKCKYRFSTLEKPEPTNLHVIKRDGTTEQFDRKKIKHGLEKALNKRPFDKKTIEQITDEIEHEIRQKHSGQIKSIFIGKAILNKLKNIDKIGYVRFISVYRNFKNLKTFYKEIDKLK